MMQIAIWALAVVIVLIGVLIARLDFLLPRYKDEKVSDDYKYCPACREEFPQTTTECAKCNSPLNTGSRIVQKQVKENSMFPNAIIIISILVAVILVYLAEIQAQAVGDALDSTYDILNSYKSY